MSRVQSSGFSSGLSSLPSRLLLMNFQGLDEEMVIDPTKSSELIEWKGEEKPVTDF